MVYNQYIRDHETQNGEFITQGLYIFDDGVGVWCPINSCVFCKKCSDIWYDYSNGPYMYACEEGNDLTEKGHIGECEKFEDDSSNVFEHNMKIEKVKEELNALLKDEDVNKLFKEAVKEIEKRILFGW